MPENNLVHLAGRLFNTPLYITPEKLEVIMSVLRPRLLGQGPVQMDGHLDQELVNGVADKAAPPAQSAATDMERLLPNRLDAGNGKQIAVIRVFGTLVHRSGWLGAMSGLISYESLRAQHRAALHSPAISGVLYHFATNGGEGAGLFDLVDEIHQSRGIKPIHAFVDERAFSAGYALASAAGVVHQTRTAGGGSIGVIAQHVDQSAWNEKTGLTVTPVFAGARKNDFSPHQPLSNEAKAVLQKMVDDGYDLFTKTVARNRNMNVKAVRATEAALYWGEEAIDAGLADGIKTWDQAVEAIISAARTNRKNGGTRMSKDVLVKQLTALCAGDEPAVVAEAMSDLGYQRKATPEEQAAQTAAHEQALAAAKKSGADEAVARTGEIIGLCDLAGTPQLLGPLLKSGKSVEEARAEIVNAKAADSERKTTISTVGGGPGDGINYLLRDAQARAEAGK